MCIYTCFQGWNTYKLQDYYYLNLKIFRHLFVFFSFLG